MMILGPSFEFYLLDTEGNILTYDAEPGKIKREQVDLSPIHAFLNNSETLPIWGDDPRHDHRKKIFSVTEITNEQGLQGYLYIIIGGELYDGVVNLMKNSHIATIGLWLMGAAILFSMLVTLLLFGFLTRPLRKLSQEMTLFSQKGFEKVDLVSQNSAHWNPDSPDEIERLGANFHKMADALGQQYEHIKSTDELRRELISYVSHDLRTPLASLQGYLETWQLNHQNMDQAESASLIDIALKNSQQVSRLVEQLFELAHLDSHTLTLEKEPVVITELAYDVIQSKRMDAEKKGVLLKVNSDHPSAKVSANIERLERVFSNLIDNAIRHCKSGDSVSIDITIEPEGPCSSSLYGRERKSTESPQYEHVCVHVTDTGSGIPAEDLKFVFNNHFRASNAVKSRHSGSGLGLAITRRILDLHGSQIEVTSELEKGTCFSFALAYVH
jgi:signal transduction histidine kinase